MAKDKNALAELAERMAVVTSGHGDTWRWLEDVSKAQRIVSVLASHYEPCFPAKSGDDVIDECRAIAEEGGEK